MGETNGNIPDMPASEALARAIDEMRAVDGEAFRATVWVDIARELREGSSVLRPVVEVNSETQRLTREVRDLIDVRDQFAAKIDDLLAERDRFRAGSKTSAQRMAALREQIKMTEYELGSAKAAADIWRKRAYDAGYLDETTTVAEERWHETTTHGDLGVGRRTYLSSYGNQRSEYVSPQAAEAATSAPASAPVYAEVAREQSAADASVIDQGPAGMCASCGSGLYLAVTADGQEARHYANGTKVCP